MMTENTDSVEIEIVSDEEFQLLDDAIQRAMQGEGDEEALDNEESIRVRHKYNFSKQTTAGLLTPLEKYRGGRLYLSVSELTAQFWCEQQMEYNFLIGEKQETKEMQMGKDIHLAREVEIYDIVQVDIKTKEDQWGFVFLNCLTQIAALEAKLKVRELAVFGEPFSMGMFVHGIIDELRFNDFGQLELLELKTRSGNAGLPSKAQQERTYLQTMLYCNMFNDLISGKLERKLLFSQLQLSGDAELSNDLVKFSKECGLTCNKLSDIVDALLKRFQVSKLPNISCIIVEYCSRDDCTVISKNRMELDETWTRHQLAMQLPYWRGQRLTVGVDIEEAWKCQRCEFADVCAWRIQKDQECRKKTAVDVNLLKS